MKTKKVMFLGLSVALAMVLSFIESQIPPLFVIPGIKVGLPNIVMVVLLYKIGWREAVAVNIIRIVFVSMLFGNIQTMTFSIAGAMLSLVGMIPLKRWFSCITVSILGGTLHNIGQIIMAVIWTDTAQILSYLPVLLISGFFAGVAVGIVSGIIVKKIENVNL